MTLKQLLGILLLPCIACAMAAAGPQLTQVSIGTEGGATSITLHATGPFTHTEYRPSDNLLLVDLAGVSAAKMDGKSHALNGPNAVSYRVLGYKGSDGSEVSRIEIGLASGAQVKLSEGADQVSVLVSGNVAPASASKAQPRPAETVAKSAKLATIQKLTMVHGRDGMELEIVSNAPLSPKAAKLTGPDRLVLDIPNAKALIAKKEIAVNADAIKDVRMARYQNEPPVTRVVVDLAENRDFELVPTGNKLMVKFHAPAPAAAAPITATATPSAIPAAPISAATTAAKNEADVALKPAEFAVVTAEMHPVAPKPSASQTASDAASKFMGDKPDTVFNVGPTSSASLQPTNVNFQIQPQAAAATAGSRPKYTGEPISVNLKDVDLKDFFRLIHEISGLNVVLDPNVHGTLTIVLDDVPWDQALDIVLKNNGLDRQLEGNVLRIATVDTLRKEAEARRGQIEAQALAVDKVTVTRFLSYAHSKDVVATVKKFLSSRGDVVSDDRTNALIIDDIPNTIPKIDELLAKLDRKTPEVEIEARVVAATRNFAREIGTQFAFGTGNKVTAVGGGLAQNSFTQVNNVANPQYVITGTNQIPLFSNLGATGPTSALNFTNATNAYRIDFVLTAAETRGLIKILSRPRVVTQNNIQALVRQGVRVPITTQAQLGGPPTVTYVDAFLRLTVTPQITAESTIFLNVDVENTTPDFSHEIQGNPTLLTQQATTQVLVTDGGTVVIGGVIQTTNSIAIDQVPLLGNIPIFGNLFKHRKVSTQTQELIFFITPRIIQT